MRLRNIQSDAKYVDLLTETKEATCISKLCQSSFNSNLVKLVTKGQRKNTESCRLKKPEIA
jgi:hypothetical protein